jgi:RND family efflux transporter MFP subunit
MKKLILILLPILAVTCGYKLWIAYAKEPWTRDAKINVEVVELAPLLDGQVIDIKVVDNQIVKKGDLLYTIDPIDYELELSAKLKLLKKLTIEKDNVQRQYIRRSQLSNLAIAREELDDSRTLLNSYDNQVEQIEIEIRKARLNLKRTKIMSPVTGYVTNLTLRKGEYTHKGVANLAIVDNSSFYVTAYFEETKMDKIKVGQKAKIKLLGTSTDIFGKVTGIGRAIVDNSSSTGEQLLRKVEPNYPWVRLAQRIPVKIEIYKSSDIDGLVAGLTCSVKIIY